MDKKKILIVAGLIILGITTIVVGLLIGNTKQKTYEVSFETNGGSVVESQIVNEGDQVKKPVDPTKDGYMFFEWTYQGKTYDFSLEVTSNLVLTARWTELKEDVKTFIVKFETDGGTTIPNQIVEKGKTVAKPIDPVKEGYTFKGWLLNDKIYDFTKIIEENIELKAKWEKVEEKDNEDKQKDKKYTVTYNSNGGSKVSSQTITEGSKISRPSDPTRRGYIFAGWLLNGSPYDFNKAVTSNITLVAKWNEIKAKYTVTFNSNGGSAIGNQTVTEGSKVSKPSDPTRKGYTFAGWLLNGSAYDFNKVVTGNITLIAKWNEDVKEKYTVTFNSNGGSAVSSQTVTEGSKATKPKEPTKTGYNFAGWLLNGSAYDFNKTVTGNITLVAKWNQKSYTIKVTPVDQYSPDRILTVYEEGTQISVSAIKNKNVTLCSGSNMVVNMYEINGINSLTIILIDGTSVTASVQ